MAVLTARKPTKQTQKRITFVDPFENWRRQRELKPKAFTFRPRVSRERTLLEFNRVQKIIFKRLAQGQPVPSHWVKAYFALESQLKGKPMRKVA